MRVRRWVIFFILFVCAVILALTAHYYISNHTSQYIEYHIDGGESDIMKLIDEIPVPVSDAKSRYAVSQIDGDPPQLIFHSYDDKVFLLQAKNGMIVGVKLVGWEGKSTEK